MWPFKKKSSEVHPFSAAPQQISYSQLDVTEAFGDNLKLGVDDWIGTVPLSGMIPDPDSSGLPPAGAADDDIYRIADAMSRMRESIPIADDGVYCPVCHIANVSLARLRKPCPKCGRPLLKFGWD